MSVEKEVKALKEAFEGSTTVQKLRWDDGERGLSFTLTGSNKRAVRFQFFVPSGYPQDKSPDERPTLMQEDGSHEDIIDNINAFSAQGESLTNTFQQLVREWRAKFSLKASGNPATMEVEKKKDKGKKIASSDDEDSEEHESSYDDDDDIMSDDDGDLGVVGGDAKVREAVEDADAYYGKGTAKYFPELQLVRLFVDTSFIPPATAGALGVDCTIPINVTLHFADDYMSNPVPPKFEVDQKPNNDKFSLQFQVTEILRHWLQTNWGQEVYDTVAHASGPKATSVAPSKPTPAKNAKPPSSSEEYAPAKKYPKQLQELLEVGFDRTQALYALHHTGGKTDEAINLCLDPQPWFVEEAEKAALLMSEAGQGKGRNLKRSQQMLNQSQAGKAKTNFFIAMISYLKSRIGNCSNFCPICDARHECEGVKPIVCSKPDCIWRYEELGLGANVNSEIARAPEVVDLMISLALSASECARAEDVLVPYPSDFLDEKKAKDFNRLKQTLNDLPPLSDLKEFSEIRATLDKLDPNPPGHKVYYRLIRWLLTSNRAHLIRLSEEQQFAEMATPYQYMLLMSNPEKEARFAQLKKKHGSFLAFHGSPLENWHSIMHNGLRNLSNTKGMLHGAAHGAGIYLAPNAGTSQGYMRVGSGWSKSVFGRSAGCLALCEVIDHESVFGRDHSQWCYVVKEDDHVMTRYFFIYNGTGAFPSSINARQLQVRDVTGSFKINS
eukprot:TRINITY_DN5141_c0_g1_i1.p1 TRINITY_DN5141_c0_g1~~TRINITY_DN5141_c0_g1_i1.p1  ORF type:complete len:723 (-),score=132.06 TRINITY_DN5141_c0_g1_i1:71-2239(-)